METSSARLSPDQYSNSEMARRFKMSENRRIKSAEVIPLILTILILSSCDRLRTTSGAPPTIDSGKAREFGDYVTDDLLRDDLKDLHKKLEKPFVSLRTWKIFTRFLRR